MDSNHSSADIRVRHGTLRLQAVIGLSFVVGLAVLSAATQSWWMPHARQIWAARRDDPTRLTRNKSAESVDESTHDHNHHEDLFAAGHLGHDEAAAIRLSAAGLKNIDFESATIGLATFERTMNVPGIVIERPGHSQLHVTAPMSGVVTHVNIMSGAAVEPGSPLFGIRLTHEELVAAQSEFLQTTQSLQVVQREIARLESLGEGVVAGRRVLEQGYEQDKLAAAKESGRQALLLHGLSDSQVDAIEQTGKLLDVLNVESPEHDAEHDGCRQEHLYHVQQLTAKVGEHVEAGQLLCVLADHCELCIEGRAFEADVRLLQEAARTERRITARIQAGQDRTEVVDQLQILYLSDSVDVDTRAVRFYLNLPNSVVLDRQADNGFRFLSWRFNPGQRLELQVPVETWTDRIVLPVEAVVDDGAETFVYEQNEDHFDRVAVHVEYRDQNSVVISNDGSLLPGDIVAVRGAYQMHLALKNRSGVALDPHAGHNH